MFVHGMDRSWRPSAQVHDQRFLDAAADQKAALEQQIEETRRRKQAEKARQQREDEDEEYRVRAELAVVNG